MAEDVPTYAPLLLQRSAPISCEGVSELLSLHWKAYAFSTGTTTWELRRVIDTVIGDNGPKLSKMLWNCGYFVDLFSRCLATSSEIVPSQSAYASAPDKWHVPAWSVRQEYCITTVGLLVLLLDWTMNRRRRLERARCREALAQWLRALVVIDEMKEMLREAVVEGAGDCAIECDEA
eukprot:2590470-Amphidinium_carterae.2